MIEGRSNLERAVSVTVELASLALVWRALDGPDPRDLLRDAWDALRRRFESELQYRRAMEATLERIRDLPETEGNP